MANFDIIYRIATDLSGLTKGVDQTAKATEAIEKKMTGLQGSVANVGKALVGVFAAGAIAGAIKGLATEVISLGSHLVDVSAKTGISLKGLQLLKVAAEQNGVSLDSVATAANKLGINIAGGGKDVVTAVSKLGLSLADLRKGDPEQNLFAIAKAMDGIENPAERAKIAMTLFGKAGIELLPILNGKFSEAAAAAERLGIVMSDDVVMAADEFDDQMVVVKASLMKVVADGLAPLLPGMLELMKLFTGATGGAVAFGRAIVDSVIGAVLKAKEVFLGFATIMQDIALSVPGLAKLFGTTQADAFAKMKAKTQEAADAYKAFRAETARSASGIDDHATATKKALPVLGEWGKGQTEAAAAADKAAAARKKLADQLEGYEVNAWKTNSAAVKAGWEDIHEAAERMGEQIQKNYFRHEELRESFEAMTFAASTGSEAWVKSLESVGQKFVELPPIISNVGVLIKGKLGDVFKSIPQTLVSAFTGGGGVGGAIKAIGSMVGGGIGESISGSLAASAKKNIGGALDTFLKSGLGQVVSSAIPVIGSLIGPAISGLGKLFGFGESAAEKALKEAKKLRESFISSAGGLDVLQQKAQAAGVTLLTVLNAKTPEAYKKAIDDLNAAFEFQDEAMQTLDATVEKYGFTLAEVPEKFRQGKLNEQFIELYKDQRILTAGGFEFDAILVKQRDSFVELIKVAIETGAAIPAQLKPAVDRLIEMGLVTDENGVALAGLENLTFAETLEEKFGTLIETINRLADAITRGVGGALAGLPSEKEIRVGVTFFDRVKESAQASYGARGGAVVRNGIQYLGAGGPVGPWVQHGLDTVPAMLSVGEGVLSRDGMSALGALNAGRSPGNVVSMDAFLAEQRRTSASIDGLRRDLATTIPTMVGLAARHGTQTRGKR